MQNLTYFEHMSEPMAELLNVLEKEFDHTQVTEEVLRYVFRQGYTRHGISKKLSTNLGLCYQGDFHQTFRSSRRQGSKIFQSFLDQVGRALTATGSQANESITSAPG
jgi:hypothetical protein